MTKYANPEYANSDAEITCKLTRSDLVLFLFGRGCWLKDAYLPQTNPNMGLDSFCAPVVELARLSRRELIGLRRGSFHASAALLAPQRMAKPSLPLIGRRIRPRQCPNYICHVSARIDPASVD